ncbi:MAG: sterol desaturase family protein [Burkholderiales bacterium]|nr:sterol desaturase family protein [Burkholderiales bacterium]
MFKTIASWAFLFGSVAGGIVAVLAFNFDPARIGMYYLMPYYIACTAMQYLWPEQANRFEPGEVLTDTLSNGAMFAMAGLNNLLIHALIAATGSGLLFHFGVLDERFAAHHLPFAAQVAISFLTFDFMFYVTHRLAHELEFLWRLHSVHHCAHRLSVLNASRAHPLDLLWRRIVPSFVAFQTGISPEAFIMGGVIGSVLATITHMNVDFRFGALNHLIGTNEIHRWHHSNKIDEAKNYAIFMLWDRLFGTFVYPAGRSRPEHMGLFNEQHYPVHNFWRQLWVPVSWKRMKARQLQSGDPMVHPAGLHVTPTSPPAVIMSR